MHPQYYTYYYAVHILETHSDISVSCVAARQSDCDSFCVCATCIKQIVHINVSSNH